jgi:hypothetical protein
MPKSSSYEALLRGGTVSSELGPVSFRFGDLPSTLNIAWSAWLSSEYGLGRFSIWLPPGVAEAIYISAAGCGADRFGFADAIKASLPNHVFIWVRYSTPSAPA